MLGFPVLFTVLMTLFAAQDGHGAILRVAGGREVGSTFRFASLELLYWYGLARGWAELCHWLWLAISPTRRPWLQLGRDAFRPADAGAPDSLGLYVERYFAVVRGPATPARRVARFWLLEFLVTSLAAASVCYAIFTSGTCDLESSGSSDCMGAAVVTLDGVFFILCATMARAKLAYAIAG